MASRTPPVLISDDETTHDYGHQPTPHVDTTTASPIQEEEENTQIHRKTSRRGNNFKSRKSVINEEDQATFWSITSFSETSLWTQEQKDDAVDQAHRLATHYLKVIKEQSDMFAQIEKLNTRVELLDSEVQNLRQDNNDLENELAKKQGAIEYLEGQQRQSSVVSSNPDASNTKNRAKLEDPDKFSGSKDCKIDFETWKSNIEAKLKVDDRSFDDENHKIFYICSRTTDAAQDHIRDRIDNDEFTTVKEVIRSLETIYGDPHKAIKAEAELQRLGQTQHGSFYTFHSEFVRIVRPLKYNSDKLKEQLIARLNDKFISAAGAYLDLPYADLVEKLHSIDKRFESQRATRENRKQLTALTNSKPTDNPASGRANSTAQIASTNSAEKASIRTRAEFDALHQAGLCKKCCKPNHTKPGERCQEKTWAQMPANIKATVAKDAKQVNNVEAGAESGSKN
jgi:hypothetical protein